MTSTKIPIKNSYILNIRPAEVEDAQEILEYLERISTESDNITFGAGEVDITIEQERSYLQSIQQSHNNIYILGLIDEQIVATANISAGSRPRIRHLGELSISVAKKYWRHGIGRAMLTYLVSWAKNTGLRKINLDVRSDHAGAIKLYQEIGFEPVGVSSRTMLIDDEFVDTLIMGLEIDP